MLFGMLQFSPPCQKDTDWKVEQKHHPVAANEEEKFDC